MTIEANYESKREAERDRWVFTSILNRYRIFGDGYTVYATHDGRLFWVKAYLVDDDGHAISGNAHQPVQVGSDITVAGYIRKAVLLDDLQSVMHQVERMCQLMLWSAEYDIEMSTRGQSRPRDAS